MPRVGKCRCVTNVFKGIKADVRGPHHKSRDKKDDRGLPNLIIYGSKGAPSVITHRHTLLQLSGSTFSEYLQHITFAIWTESTWSVVVQRSGHGSRSRRRADAGTWAVDSYDFIKIH
ncbi:hypothetical protein EVAR_60852_1 [Eumeta japonica]|uniref:Uncharacterized protein n=1 Tax=Eumeta variegata TaxID=151549 RepID=A0A4C1Y5X3_EUMVA|nr:hypothetical protein EVAR_60852_1 [Eumeta japonica]